MWLGDHEEAIAQYERTIEAIDAMGGTSAVPRMNLANLHADLGHWEQAKVGYVRTLKEAQAQGNRVMEASITTNLGCLHLDLGELDAARRLLHDALAMHRQHGVRRWEAATLLGLGEVALRRGAWGRADQRFEAARHVAQTAQLARHAGSATLGLAGSALQRGDVERAEGLACEAETRLRQVDHAGELARAVCVGGLVACALGTRAVAEARLVEAKRLVPEAAGQPRSEVGQLVARLQQAIATHPSLPRDPA